MVSSYTPRNRLNKQGTGDNTNTWGDVLNAGALELVDFSLDGWASINPAGSVTLTTANGATDQARARHLKLITAAATAITTLPAVEKLYFVWNATAVPQTIASAGGGTSVTLEAGDKLPVFTDGVNVYTLSINGLGLKGYIDAAVLGATGSLPAATGNEGKALLVRSGVWTPDRIVSADVFGLDLTLAANVAQAKAIAIAFAAAL